MGVCRKANPAPEGAKETKGSLTAKFAKDAKKALNRRVRRGFAEHAVKSMNVTETGECTETEDRPTAAAQRRNLDSPARECRERIAKKT